MGFLLEQDVTGTEDIIRFVIYIVEAAIILALLICASYAAYRLLRWYCFKNLEYKRYFSEKGAFEEQEIYLIEEFTNHSILPMFRVDVETHITSKLYVPGLAALYDTERETDTYQEFISRFFIMPYTRIRRRHRIICKKRGLYRLESAKISFMRIEIFLDSTAELKVYPRELKIDGINTINNCIYTNAVAKRPVIKDVFSLAKVREYNYGDAMNTINHKATAKSGKLMVNECEFVMGRRMIIYLNFEAGNTGISAEAFQNIMEKSMEYVAYIAGEALREGWQIGYRANCKMEDGSRFVRIGIGAGYGKYIEILEALAETRTVFGNSIGYVFNMDIDAFISNTEIFIFTAYTDLSIQERIEKLESMGNKVYVIDLKEVTVYEED